MTWRRLHDTPELNVAIFAFLLNLPWEFWQVPFYLDMPHTTEHWGVIKDCTRATVGDALLAVTAYWLVAATVRTRSWILRPRLRDVTLFVLIGVGFTVLLEWHATTVGRRWAYAPTMPVVPGLGVGWLPLAQWVALPLLVVWFVRRQLR